MKWTIKGMHCASCAGLLTDIATDHHARDVHVSAKTGILEFTPSLETDLAKMKKEIEDEGYKVAT